MDYSLLVGIHDIEQASKEAAEESALASSQLPYVSDPDLSGEEIVPTPPESPVPSNGAFAGHAGGLNLDDEFFAIPSSPGEKSHCSRIPI